MKTAKEIVVYWDAQDKANEGWAYRVNDEHGSCASGPIDDYVALPNDANGSSLADAVVTIAHSYDIAIDSDAVAFENVEGGYAVWSSIGFK